MVIVGIDEVGRGCWAGPLVAAAVLLKQPVEGLTDSKLLSKIQREKLAQTIYDQGHTVAIGWVAPEVIDDIGLTAAVRLAMQRALQQITDAYDSVVIDGNYNFLAEFPGTAAIIKADLTVPAVSAASIVAKAARDNYMTEQAELYPGYGFEKHVGYGTASHLAGLKEVGLTPLHRRSFKPVRALL